MLSFLGDVYLDKKYSVDIKLTNFVFNLEYSISDRGTPAKSKVNLGQDKSYIKETFGRFPIAVNLANNHIMDFGDEAYQDTIAYLEANEVRYFGAGCEDNNYNNPAVVNIDNKVIALYGYSCLTTNPVAGGDGVNGSAIIELNKIKEDISSQRGKVDYIIVQLHWGDEEVKYPKPSDILLAKKILDEGADCIIGHHAHVMQSHEVYKGKYIFYGLGNFIFPDLKVKSYFDGNEYTKTYNKRQSKRNRSSIVVGLSKDFNVTYKTVRLSNDLVKEKYMMTPRLLISSQFIYKLYCKFNARLGTVNRFLREPKIPSASQLKIFFGVKKL